MGHPSVRLPAIAQAWDTISQSSLAHLPADLLRDGLLFREPVDCTVLLVRLDAVFGLSSRFAFAALAPPTQQTILAPLPAISLGHERPVWHPEQPCNRTSLAGIKKRFAS